ncbi:membrane hypothetical protein [Vibrio nigripulchritudo SOn1]|uniref:Uncharacterized protein n=1 Tax=Vibrio nigripulchritudo SOn1 TaxID=1238450 RepID=A0AAV2VQ57_9VIBR|nr:hypothetical protein [Vibrio nigripulchritudo]CCO46824.1 membrane hypothetical protein [Vibrio nigripulchritudo SOn1]
MFEDTLFDAMLNPSILHWMALMFGEWVYALSDANVPIDHPVSPFMVVLATLTVCAIIAFVILVTLIGGRAIISTGATGSIASQTSRFWHFRVITSVALLLPTNYAMNELDEYNVSVSQGQVAVIQASLWGGGVADIMYRISSGSLLKYNVSGSPALDNTVMKSNELAKAFTCNEFYHQNVGSANGQSKIHYVVSSVDPSVATTAIEGVDSISEISVSNVDSMTAPATLQVMLGGPKAYCGDFSISLSAIIKDDDSTFIGTLSRSLYSGLKHVSNVSANVSQMALIQSLDIYEIFASRYYQLFAGTAANSLVETSISESGENSIDSTKTINAGALQTASVTSLEDKVAATTDALNYLAIFLSYKQREIAHETSKQFYTELTGVEESGGSLDGFSEKLWENHMGDYVSAGMFWSVFHNLSDVMYASGRQLNAFSLSNNDIEQARLCQDANILQRGWNTVAGVFSDERFLCEASQHVIEGFNVVAAHAATKAKVTLPDSIVTSEGSKPVEKGMWRSFFSAASQDNPMNGADIDFLLVGLISLIEKVWSASLWFGDDTAVVGGGLSMDRSLLAGNDALMLDLNGTTSPFSLLTQLGQETRDLAFLVKGVYVLLKSFVEAIKITTTAATHGMMSSPIGMGFTFATFWMTLGATILSNAAAEIVDVIVTLYGILITSSLAITYAIPLIPVGGWVFIFVGILYAIGAAAASINFGAILMALPKGDGVFAPDTERIVSLVYGIFIRQGLVVVGFIFHLTIAYVGLSVLNLIWIGSFLNKFDNLSLIDGIFWVFAFFIGYVLFAFFLCLYAFKTIGNIVDTVGVWVSTHLVGGAFGSNHEDIQASAGGFSMLSGKLDDLAKSVNRPNAPSQPQQPSSGSDKPQSNPKKNPWNEVNA